MATKDARLDRYIESSPDFAKPILRHLRRLVHLGCPEVEETWKWSFPHFTYKGMLCGMAAFKEHCSFGFWKGELIIGKNGDGAGMGHFGRITAISDLPSEAKMLSYIREAVRLNDEGIKRPARARRTNRKELVVPDYFLSALKKNKKAQATFENFSPSHRREYVEWLTAAKREETRKQRLQTTIQWLAEGKSRNWKYERC